MYLVLRFCYDYGRKYGLSAFRFHEDDVRVLTYHDNGLEAVSAWSRLVRSFVWKSAVPVTSFFERLLDRDQAGIVLDLT